MSEIYERIRVLRKDELDLSQQKFGDRIGVSRDVIKNMELNLVEVKEHFIKLICAEFNVSEDWLRNGIGEMFITIPEEDEFLRAATEISIEKDEFAMQAVIDYWKLDPVFKKEFKKYILGISKKITE